MTAYADYLRTHAEITLDSVLMAEAADLGIRPAGAMLALMVNEHGGVDAVKSLLRAGRSDAELRDALSRSLGIPWQEIMMEWRRRILAS
jgi:hypothetical protein